MYLNVSLNRFKHVYNGSGCLVLGHLSIGVHHHLQAPGHAVRQLLELLGWGPGAPEPLDLLLQLLDAGHIQGLELVLHPVPVVFNWIKVWAIPRPVNDLRPKLLLLLVDDSHGGLAHMRPGPILEEELSAVSHHEGEQVILDAHNVLDTVHCFLLRDK